MPGLLFSLSRELDISMLDILGGLLPPLILLELPLVGGVGGGKLMDEGEAIGFWCEPPLIIL